MCWVFLGTRALLELDLYPRVKTPSTKASLARGTSPTSNPLFSRTWCFLSHVLAQNMWKNRATPSPGSADCTERFQHHPTSIRPLGEMVSGMDGWPQALGSTEVPWAVHGAGWRTVLAADLGCWHFRDPREHISCSLPWGWQLRLRTPVPSLEQRGDVSLCVASGEQ